MPLSSLTSLPKSEYTWYCWVLQRRKEIEHPDNVHIKYSQPFGAPSRASIAVVQLVPAAYFDAFLCRLSQFHVALASLFAAVCVFSSCEDNEMMNMVAVIFHLL